MRGRILVWLLMLGGALLLFAPKVYAAQEEPEETWQAQMEALPLEGVDDVLEKEGVSFSAILDSIAQGNWRGTTEMKTGLRAVFSAMSSQKELFRELFFLAAASALLAQTEGATKRAPLGVMVCSLALTALVLASFYTSAHLVAQTVGHMEELLSQMLPVYLTLMAMSGQITQTAALAPAVMGGSFFVTKIVREIVVPAVGFGVCIAFVNALSPRQTFGALARLCRQGTSWALKGVSLSFMAVLGLMKLGTSGMDGALGQTAKAAVGAVPIVGDILTGSVEAAGSISALLRHSAMVGVAVALFFVVLLPVLQVGAVMLLYKVAAALLEPIAEKRIISSLESAGDFTALLLGALFVCVLAFWFGAVLLLTVVG